MASKSPEAPTPIPTIPQMIESLSNLHQELSSVLPKLTTTAAVAAAEETQGHQPETTATTKANSLKNLLLNIEHLKAALEKTSELDKKLNKPIQSIEANLETVIKTIESNPDHLNQNFLDVISKDVKTLKFQIPSYKKLSLAGTTARMVDSGTGKARQDGFRLPNLYGHKVFDESPAFKEIEVIYRGFDDHCQKCFLYFAVFPENVVFKKRFLTYWWIGEGLLDRSILPPDEWPEVRTGRVLKKFAEKGLIVPVKEDQKMIKKKFRMPPIVRSAAIKLAKDHPFLDYDSDNNPIGKSPGCDRIFLVKGPFHVPGAPTAVDLKKLEDQKKLDEGIKSIFNVSQPFPDSALEWLAKRGVVDMRTVKAVEWLLKLKNLKVLYLGRWQSEVDEQQIEVESYDFLKGLKKMKKLRLLSLQGISWINKLPNSLRTLSELRVLDLKSCFNLEKLPQSIGSLKNLTHLDVSGCYMLNEMPKSISKLTELTVLKGFITGRSTLKDLKGLKKLRKLSINISKPGFPDQMDLHVLQGLGERGMLRSLTIIWGAGGVKKLGEEVKQPPSEEEVKQPSGKGVKQPSSTEEVKQPSLGEGVEEPSLGEGVKQPSSAEEMKQPSLGEGVKQPSLGEVVEEPSSAEEVKQPSLGERVKQPSSREVVEEPSLGGVKHPSSGEGGKQPSSGKRNMIRQITKKLLPKEPEKPEVVPCLPKELEKLEVQCLPENKLPKWLDPSNLTSLKRLYIRGGELSDLGAGEWKAEVVRLKYMKNLEIEWRKLRKSFPNLSYLQKVQCPKVTFCPCDANGVWMKP